MYRRGIFQGMDVAYIPSEEMLRHQQKHKATMIGMNLCEKKTNFKFFFNELWHVPGRGQWSGIDIDFSSSAFPKAEFDNTPPSLCLPASPISTRKNLITSYGNTDSMSINNLLLQAITIIRTNDNII